MISVRKTTMCLLFAVTSTTSSAMASASLDAVNARIAALETKVSALQKLTQTLANENNQLKAQLLTLAGTQADQPQTCEARLTTLQEKHAHLGKLGLREGHPDMINVKRQIEDVSGQC